MLFYLVHFDFDSLHVPVAACTATNANEARKIFIAGGWATLDQILDNTYYVEGI